MKKAKILIVEDEGIISMDMANSLEMMGYEVFDAVSSGEEAISLVDEEEPDLILMDVQLSGELDGIKTAEILNKKHNIPIIYISGHTDELTVTRAKTTGPYGYITKSFNYHELRTTIDMAIHKNEMQKKVAENEFLLNTTLENIDDSVITVDNDGRIQYLNASAVEMLSLTRKQAHNSKIDRISSRLVSADGQELVHPYSKGKSLKQDKTEYSLINSNAGTETPVECSINILYDSARKRKGYVYLIRNIEQRRKIDAIQSRLASIVESSKDAIIGIDTSGTIRSWNRGAGDLFGYSFEEVEGQNISMFTPPNIPNELPERIERLKEGEIVQAYESVRQCKNGELMEMSILPSPILDKSGEISGISFVARNITEKKMLEKEIIEIEEQERERIGRDLHDSLGQQLTGILLNMKTIENMVKQKVSEADMKQIIDTEEMIKTAVQQTRTMAKNLIPMKLQTEGLPQAIEDLANFARTVYKKKVETNIDEGIDNLSAIVETQIYHIAQEAVNNSIKHSGGSKISISLNIIQSEIVLSVKDDGTGFKKGEGNGIGISIMKYRANLVSGTLFIHSEEDEGSIVLCRVPLPNPERQ